MDLKLTQRRASYFIIAMIMWEFFSFYGMQAILILYLTQKLHIAETQAYAIFGSFTSLIYVTPIIGGWLADRYCGYRYAASWGCILIIVGHLTLGTLTHSGLYLGLGFLILGIGLFKSNAICLIGDCYPGDVPGKSAAFAWYYVSGNIGAVASQWLCPYLAQSVSWHWGFLAAAIGMLLGLLMLLMSIPFFGWYKSKWENNKWTNLSAIMRLLISIVLVVVALAVVIFVLYKLLVGSLLIVVTILAAISFVMIFKKANKKQRESLLVLIGLTLFATAFWIIDQQGSSSVVLFIDHFVIRNLGNFSIPAGSYQSINPAVVLTVGSLVAFIWRYLGRRNINPPAISKLTIGLLLLTAGFFCIATAAQSAELRKVAMLLPVLGLALTGAAEIFVDPVLLSSITNAAPERSEGQLVAIYYLFTGAIANYLAGQMANFTVDPTKGVGTAQTYHQAYSQFYWITAAAFIILAIWSLWAHFSKNRITLAV
jgi:POT family proton-dependent oligopeptide transporter